MRHILDKIRYIFLYLQLIPFTIAWLWEHGDEYLDETEAKEIYRNELEDWLQRKEDEGK